MIWTRLRGTIGIAITWTLAWGILGAALTAAQTSQAIRRNPAFDGFDTLAALPSLFIYWASAGAIAGSVFAVLVIWIERRHSLDDLIVRRMASWGALGGASLPMLGAVGAILTGNIPSDWLTAPLIGGGLGSLCAATTLRIAQRGSRMAAPPSASPARQPKNR